MSAQHTPGPWTADWNSGSHGYTIAGDHIAIGTAFSLLGKRYGTGEASANARLIAAAPELLAALGLLETASRRVAEGHEMPDAYLRKMCERARAAIAKAEGRAP
jgi:hypothetical protein